MNKSKKIFLAFAAVFFLTMIIVGYDISKRTTFPGSKKLIIETLAPSEPKDSIKVDTTQTGNDLKTTIK